MRQISIILVTALLLIESGAGRAASQEAPTAGLPAGGTLAAGPGPATAIAPSPAATSPGVEVPAAFIERLRAQYIAEDDRTDGGDTEKVRAYESILRQGAWAERQYPEAPNLGPVLELMLAAARGLATIDASEESHRRLMELAGRVAASPRATPDARVLADLLSMRARLDAMAAHPAEAADEVEGFVARYASTPAAHKALIGAAQLCRLAEAGGLRQEYIQLLAQRHFSAPGVAEFLEAEGTAPYIGRLFSARLTTPDGNTVCLPRDLLGRLAVVHFWSMARSGVSRRGGETLGGAWQAHRQHGLAVVGINLDSDHEAAARFARQAAMDWPIAFSGLGMKDPTFQRYRLPTLPAYWLISPDGRAIHNNHHRYSVVQDWGGIARGNVYHALVSMRETMLRAPYYRSGEFLLDVPQAVPAATAAGPNDVPDAKIEAMRDLARVPPALGLTAERKAARMADVLEAGAAVEKDRPLAGNLTAVRTIMLVAARWLALETRAKGAARQSLDLAAKVLAARPPAGAAALAEYVRLSEELAGLPATDQPRQQIARRINAYVDGHAATDATWAAAILAAVLATECGDEQTRTELVNRLHERYLDGRPKVRGFLRDFCRINVDSRTRMDWMFSTSPAGSPNVTIQPQLVRSAVRRADGRELRLADEFKGKLVVVHFWSAACPPEVPAWYAGSGRHGASDLLADERSGIVVVGVNLDRTRAEMDGWLKEPHRCRGWVQCFGGQGMDEPLVRELDVYGLPRSMLLDRDGTIYQWGVPGHLGEGMYRATTTPFAGWPATSPWPPSGSTATAPAEPPREIELPFGAGGPGMKMCLINSVVFRMGAPPAEKGRNDDETPQRKVVITRPYYLGRTHVTRGQFAAFVKDAGYRTTAEKVGSCLLWDGQVWRQVAGASWLKPGFDQLDDHPVVCVSWDDASAFCAWLSGKAGRAVRLPTEAEWELACRGGTGSAYPWGESPDAGAGWCNAADRSAAARFPHWRTFAWDDGHVFTSPVGRFKPGPAGLCDMLGNVWQWCSDYYEKAVPIHGSLYDPKGPPSGDFRVARGGSWAAGPWSCRSASRRRQAPNAGTNILGFRAACSTNGGGGQQPATGPEGRAPSRP